MPDELGRRWPSVPTTPRVRWSCSPQGAVARADCTLALGCDLVIASSGVRFTELSARLGLPVALGRSCSPPS